MNNLTLTITEHDSGRVVEQFDGDPARVDARMKAVCEANPDTRYTFVITVDATAAELDW